MKRHFLANIQSCNVFEEAELGFADGAEQGQTAEIRGITDADLHQQILDEKQRRWDLASRLGKAHAIERSNQRLPIQSSYLGPISVIRLRRTLETELREGRLHSNLLRGALATTACMVTGRPLPQIAELQIRRLKPPFNPRGTHYGLVSVESALGWWLPPGSPSSRQSVKRAGTQTIWPHRGIWLPCTNLFLHLLRCSLRERGIKELSSAVPIFEDSSDGIRRDAAKFIGLANEEYDCRLTLQRAEGWLRRTIYSAFNGDLAVAHIITNNNGDRNSDSVSHYTCLPYKDILRTYRDAISQFDKIAEARSSVPGNVAEGFLGSRYRPRRELLLALAAQLRAEIRPGRGKRPDPLRAHNAMVLYTVALIGLATGFRPVNDPLPHPDMIDEETGFVVIDDKSTEDNYTARLVWLPKVARQQLRFFDRHLKTLEVELGEKYESVRRLLKRTPHTKLFIFSKRGNAIKFCQKHLTELLNNYNFHFRPNFGRHYLRNSLVGVVDSDALHAFFGHWHSGTEPWSRDSALDPFAFRDAIAAPLEELLARDEWIAIPGLTRRRRPSRPAPDTDLRREQSGCCK